MTDKRRAELKQQAAVNRAYSERCLATFDATSRPSALYMGQVHAAEAERKEALAAA